MNALKSVFLIGISLLLLSGCAGRPEDGVIKEDTVLNNMTGKVDLPHTEGYITTDNTGIQLWYDIFGSMNNPKVLLIHGTDAQGISWRPHLYEQIVNAGYCVIRYDGRDCGLSERFGRPKGFKPGEWTPEQAPPYTLDDMADDAIGLLEKLNVKKAHVVGHSQGGMIAQAVAINRPGLVISLSLLSTSPSNTFDETYGIPDQDLLDDFIVLSKKLGFNSMFWPITRKKVFKLQKLFFEKIDTDLTDPQVETTLEDFVSEMFSNGRKPNPMSWEGLAVASAKSRIEELNKLNIPTLVIHGDNDIWMRYSQGKGLADNIPNAKFLTVEEGGHFFPFLNKYNDYIIEMINHFQR